MNAFFVDKVKEKYLLHIYLGQNKLEIHISDLIHKSFL